MIFITDLDRTLIYSTRVTSEYPTSDDVESVCVEINNNNETSFTSKKLVDWLKTQDRGVCIIANTARSKSEFKRLSINEYFDYAIVANGGVILKNGEVLQDWEKHLNREVLQDSLIDMQKELARMKSSTYSPKLIDNSYIFTKADNLELAKREIKSLSDKHKDFRFIMQRNKIYSIPNRISKLNAMKWLENYTDDKIKISAGDSENDCEMLEYSSIRIIPEHGELVNTFKLPYHKIKGGIDGSVEIVDIVKGYVGSI